MKKYIPKTIGTLLSALLISSTALAGVIQNYSDKIWFVTGQAIKGSIGFNNCQHYINQQDYCGIAPHGEVYINYVAASGGHTSYLAEGKITLKELNATNVSYAFNYAIKHSNAGDFIEIISPSATNAIKINKPASGSFTIY